MRISDWSSDVCSSDLAAQYFFDDRVPRAWNQWAEVVSRTPRKPFFVGDLPHAWVASDYVRSALDMFAYARDVDDSIVLAAGIPVEWFDGDDVDGADGGEGLAIRGLRTPHGELGYSLRRKGNTLVLEVADGIDVPAGGLVFPWPYPAALPEVAIDGRPAQWEWRGPY